VLDPVHDALDRGAEIILALGADARPSLVAHRA
jgi:hypothetical protein